MGVLPGVLEQYTLYHDKLPEQEYDPQGIPYGIQPDYERPYLDTTGNQRSVFVYRPSSLKPMLLARTMFLLAEERSEADVSALLLDSGLIDLAERDGVFLIIPLASDAGWNPQKDPALPDDVDFIHQAVRAARIWYLFSGR